jgi:hypothetical protein
MVGATGFEPASRQVDLRSENPQRVYTGHPRAAVQKVQGARNQRLPVCESAGGEERSLGSGLTKAKMAECQWLKPELVALFEFLEWTADTARDNHSEGRNHADTGRHRPRGRRH